MIVNTSVVALILFVAQTDRLEVRIIRTRSRYARLFCFNASRGISGWYDRYRVQGHTYKSRENQAHQKKSVNAIERYRTRWSRRMTLHFKYFDGMFVTSFDDFMQQGILITI